MKIAIALLLMNWTWCPKFEVFVVCSCAVANVTHRPSLTDKRIVICQLASVKLDIIQKLHVSVYTCIRSVSAARPASSQAHRSPTFSYCTRTTFTFVKQEDVSGLLFMVTLTFGKRAHIRKLWVSTGIWDAHIFTNRWELLFVMPSWWRYEMEHELIGLKVNIITIT